MLKMKDLQIGGGREILPAQENEGCLGVSVILPYNKLPTDPSEELLLGVLNVQRSWHSQNTGFSFRSPGGPV